ncbi:hypothetical protein FOZ63_022149 [Perkinsus olseni]|uniref:Glutaredoxin domain-containing protein n=1 Tax=Perkinsus olseni TaxID=32597 RepID=A0A7J6RJ19_PEROL|nr:hypothetical protein FOZ63_022149 [Perkinsus olseni]
MGNCLSPAGGGAPISTEEVKKLVDDEIKQNRVMVFSKSYCPHCKRAKNALNSIGAEYKVVELDGRPDCAAIQDYLNEITGARTVGPTTAGNFRQPPRSPIGSTRFY